MNVCLEQQILITKAAITMLTDIQNSKSRVSFPHVSRTGLSEAQVFELLTGLDPLIPYQIKDYTTTTTTEEDGSWNWTFLMNYTSENRKELLACKEAAERSVSFLAPQLFKGGMPDYIKAYRACAFLAGSVTYEKDPKAHPHLHDAYGALLKGSCGCQGYALAFKLLMDAAGVPCQVLSGPVLKEGSRYVSDRFDYDLRTKSTRHFWNIVGVETTAGVKYFHVDVCWGQKEKEFDLSYFLKDDFYMQKSRKWDYNSYPACKVLPGNDVEKLVRTAI